MEIKDYLRVLGKRAWLLVMIPAVAGVVAGLIAVGQPQAFRTAATLQLPRDETTTPAQVAQLVADFQAAADNPNVQNQVSEETGVPVRRIQRVRITQVGDSSQLTMSFQDRRKDATEAKDVIDGIATGALSYLQTPELRNGQQAVDAANERITEAQEEIQQATDERNALYETVQTSRPEAELNDVRDDRRQLQRDLAQARIAGNSVAISTYESLIEEMNRRTFALEGILPQVVIAEQRITAAQETLTASEETRAEAEEQLAAVSFEPDLTFSAEGQSVVRKTRVVKTAAAAVVAGFPIAIGVVLLLDAVQKRRANRPVRPDDDDELAGRADDERELEPVTGAGSPAPALIGASAGPAGLPAASTASVVQDDIDDDVDDDEYDDYDDDQAEVDEADEDLDDEDDDDADEAVVVEDVIVDEDLDGDIEDELEADIEDELEDELDDDAAVDDAAVDDAELDDLDEADIEETEAELVEDEAGLDEAELDEADLDEADLDEADLDELALAGLDEGELDDDDLDEADLGDDLEDELDDDVAATVASRRRLYDADIDEDLSVDGGPTEHNRPEHNGPQHNGLGRVWARVPAADSDFDGDDEAGADR